MSDETETQEDTSDLDEAIESASESVAVQSQALDELAGASGEGEGVGLKKLLDVPVRVAVEVGRVRMNLGELVQLKPGSLLVLDRASHEPADLLVNGKIVARGEIVTIDNSYGIRITSTVEG